ncbi:hypothetical protein 206_0150 [Phage 206]|nr:hypothetical protein 203_0150 [Phage 203]ATW61714.1 hypothetical protein 206_0150 [Phage 206]
MKNLQYCMVAFFAALFTFSNVCITLGVWAFRRPDGWKSAGQYLIC